MSRPNGTQVDKDRPVAIKDNVVGGGVPEVKTMRPKTSGNLESEKTGVSHHSRSPLLRIRNEVDGIDGYEEGRVTDDLESRNQGIDHQFTENARLLCCLERLGSGFIKPSDDSRTIE